MIMILKWNDINKVMIYNFGFFLYTLTVKTCFCEKKSIKLMFENILPTSLTFDISEYFSNEIVN